MCPTRMSLRTRQFLALIMVPASLALSAQAAAELEDGWASPPTAARVRAYWWWLNGNVTQAALTRDLEEMKARGWGGALICDADGSSQDGNERVPAHGQLGGRGGQLDPDTAGGVPATARL